MLTAKDWEQPSPLPWSWEEFASSPYCATSNFLTQNTKLQKPDSAASGDMAESHLAQTGLDSKPRALGFYKDTLPRSTVTRDKFAFPSNDVPKLNALVAIFPSEYFQSSPPPGTREPS